MRILAFALVLSVPVLAAAPGARGDKQKPSVAVKASPAIGFAPMRIRVTAELKGGLNDYADYYCPTVEWRWGDDDTRSESTSDCDPYEAGKSEIKRRYTTERVFQTPGEYRVEFRIKQKDKIVGTGSTTVTVRPGLRDGGGDRW
jgi:hypothetical protein